MNIKHPVITNVKSILCICGAITALVLGQQSTFAAPPALHTVGNKVADMKGRTVRLQGVNVPSLDWDPAGERVLESIDVALSSWNANNMHTPDPGFLVRLPQRAKVNANGK